MPPVSGHNAGDHPPITPIKSATPSLLKPDHWKIYEFICRHYCATILPNAQIQHITASFAIGKETFTYKGKRIKSPGFLQAQPWQARNYCEVAQFTDKETLKVSTVSIEHGKAWIEG